MKWYSHKDDFGFNFGFYPEHEDDHEITFSYDYYYGWWLRLGVYEVRWARRRLNRYMFPDKKVWHEIGKLGISKNDQ